MIVANHHISLTADLLETFTRGLVELERNIFCVGYYCLKIKCELPWRAHVEYVLLIKGYFYFDWVKEAVMLLVIISLFLLTISMHCQTEVTRIKTIVK